MRHRSAYLAWVLAGVNLVGVAAAGIYLGLIGTWSDIFNLVTFGTFVAACAVVGALVSAKRPSNPIGWILSSAGSFGIVAAITSVYIEQNPTPIGSPGSWADWIGSFIWTLVFVPAIFVIQLFPSGRPLGRRWVPVLWMAGLGSVFAVGAFALMPGPMTNSIDPALNPYGAESLRSELEILSDVGGALIIGSIALSVLSLVLRFRRSEGVERQQLKWFAYAGLLNLGAFVVELAVFSIVPETDTLVDISNALFSLTVTSIPVTIGFAMLRYRLYDIDRIISRTLAYGGVTAVLTAGYLLAVLALQSLLPLNDDSPAIVAASTLAVIAAFGPLRTRIKTLVDRRFNRGRYDAERTIADFGGRLRSEVELDSLTNDLVGVVENTMQPAYLSLWLAHAETSGGKRS